MEIRDILALDNAEIKERQNIIKLAKHYKEVFKKEVCLSCRGSLASMINFLKKEYNMSEFKLKGNKHFRISNKGSKVINNNIMTDELAIEFLKVDESRIRLFSNYPEKYLEMIKGEEVNDVKDSEEVNDVKDTKEDVIDNSKEREALHNIKLKELKQHYPNVEWKVGMTKEDFITLILKNNQ